MEGFALDLVGIKRSVLKECAGAWARGMDALEHDDGVVWSPDAAKSRQQLRAIARRARVVAGDNTASESALSQVRVEELADRLPPLPVDQGGYCRAVTPTEVATHFGRRRQGVLRRLTADPPTLIGQKDEHGRWHMEIADVEKVYGSWD